ncbi:FecR domain-containing protein [Achromobacter sp. DH1f]|uniref:FecR domain-containing protein n=1 Tax=Achromobacter sp. DH1f TaxID=1397275 RepID=UPI00046AD777|nr:FecR domain-containing protein [Achromobacter sp. DH1f]
MVRIWSDEASDAHKTACAQWRAQHPDHELAWSRLQFFDTKLAGVPMGLACHALRDPGVGARAPRRRALKLLAFGLAVGGIAYQVRGAQAWRTAMAVHCKETGEIREISLPDGTRVLLDNASAIDLVFDARERLIVLRGGAIMVTTAPDPAVSHRPFRVQSQDGSVVALGTRFVVRQEDRYLRVSVFEGAVKLRTVAAPEQAIRIDAGHEADFSSNHVLGTQGVPANSDAWTRGILVADDMRVSDFVAELARYRRGWVRCAPEIADLKVCGVFSLRDTDRALHNLTLGLPLEVVYRSRDWVTVQARAGQPRTSR